MATRDRILEKSLELFNDKGLHAVGVRGIARHLGLSPGNLSYHFPRKEDLVQAVLQQMKSGGETRFETYFQQEPGLVQFMELMAALFHHQYNYRGILTDISQGGTQSSSRSHFHKAFVLLSAEGQLQLNEDDVAFLVSVFSFTETFWIAEAFTRFAKNSREQVIRHYLMLLLRQLLLLSTPEGRISLLRFRAQVLDASP